MKYLQIKNYRSISDSEIHLGVTNFFVGDNNIGKTSVLKLIDSLYNFTNINLKSFRSNKEVDTYISANSFFNLARDSNKPIELFMGSWTSLKNSNKKIFMFEYLKIVEEDGTPIINEIITYDCDNNYICQFIITFNSTNRDKNAKILSNIEEIKCNVFKGSPFAKLDDIHSKTDYIGIMMKFVFDSKNLIRNKSFTLKFNREILKKLHHSSRSNLVDEIFSKEKDLKDRLKYAENFLNYNFLIHWSTRGSLNTLYSYYRLKSLDEFEEYPFLIIDSSFGSMGRRHFQNNYKTHFVPPFRDTFKPFYNVSDLNDSNQATDKYFLSNFSNKQKYKKSISFYVKESNMMDNIEIVEHEINTVKFYEPLYEKEKKKMNLSISGTGLSQSLPILINLLDENNNRLIIEQPELHLHPRAQSVLGNFFAKCHKTNLSKNSKNSLYAYQIFVETHSLYLIDSFRYHINKLLKSKVDEKVNENSCEASLIFMENTINGVICHNILILNNGTLKGNIDKFNEFFIDENLKVMGIN